jgi:hypothetical protein
MDMTNEYFLAFSRKKNAAIVGQGRQLKKDNRFGATEKVSV